MSSCRLTPWVSVSITSALQRKLGLRKVKSPACIGRGGEGWDSKPGRLVSGMSYCHPSATVFLGLKALALPNGEDQRASSLRLELVMDRGT